MSSIKSTMQQLRQMSEDFDKIAGTYAHFTDHVAVYPSAGQRNMEEFGYLALGLSSESGEAADVIKKVIRRQSLSTDDVQKLQSELGDVMFYWIRLCQAARILPSDVLDTNMQKLSGRLRDGTLKDR